MSRTKKKKRWNIESNYSWTRNYTPSQHSFMPTRFMFHKQRPVVLINYPISGYKLKKPLTSDSDESKQDTHAIFSCSNLFSLHLIVRLILIRTWKNLYSRTVKWFGIAKLTFIMRIFFYTFNPIIGNLYHIYNYLEEIFVRIRRKRLKKISCLIRCQF